MGQTTALSVELYRAKITAQRQLAQPTATSTLCLSTADIISGTATWADDHELRYQGKLYDIVSQHQVGDKIMVEVLRDENEENILAELSTHIEQLLSELPSSKHTKLPIKAMKPDLFCHTHQDMAMIPLWVSHSTTLTSTPPITAIYRAIYAPPPEV
jgi:hypothetical protein